MKSAAVGRLQSFDYTTAIYAERSTHVILRDANGFNISDGKLESAGIEFDFGWTPYENNRLSVIGTYARHTYAFDQAITRRRGHQRRSRCRYRATLARQRALAVIGRPQTSKAKFEMVYQGRYYLDAASTTSYDGFTLWNWRGTWQVNPHWRLFARVMNIAIPLRRSRGRRIRQLSLFPRHAASAVRRRRSESWEIGGLT